MKIIQAPEYYEIASYEIPCFMAGGLQKCSWHSSFINTLSELQPHNLVIFNPKRDKFDMQNPSIAVEQIEWEFKYLNKYLRKPYIFSMYFEASESDQPICFYELGRYITLLYEIDKCQGCVISVNPNFHRKLDVKVQTILATKGDYIVQERTASEHAEAVYKKYKEIKSKMK